MAAVSVKSCRLLPPTKAPKSHKGFDQALLTQEKSEQSHSVEPFQRARGLPQLSSPPQGLEAAGRP